MIKSMTGFGRGTSESEASSFIVEIKTVNHRYFELNARMPRTLISLEDGIRKYVNDKIKRGKVDIFITQNQGANEDMSVVVNESLAENYVEALHNLRDKYDLRDDISATTLARFPEVLKLEQKEEDLEKTWKILLPAVEEAVHNLVSMRQQEGEKLLIDITKRCECISSNVDIINRRVPEVTEEYRARLLKKVEEILAEKSIDENRIAMEVVLQADKSCVDEDLKAMLRKSSKLLN